MAASARPPLLLLALAFAACGGDAASPPPEAGPPPPQGSDRTPATHPVDRGAEGEQPDADPSLPQDAPAWLAGEAPEDLPAEEYVLGAGRGPSADQARAQALLQLEEQLWGPEAERPEVELPTLFDVQKDVERSVSLSNGETAVLLAVSRSSYGLRIQTWVDNPPAAESTDASTPAGMLKAALYFLHFQQRARFGCLRQQALVQSACTPTDAAVAQQQVARVAQGIKLELAYEGGLPVRRGQPLVPATVRVTWRNGDGEWVPWEGLPIRFEGPEGVVTAEETLTAADGTAGVQLLRLPTAEEPVITARVDREAVLGKAASLWAPLTVAVTPREVSPGSGRVAVFIKEAIMQDPVVDGLAATAAAQGLKDRAYAYVQVLEEAVGAPLLEARGPDLAKALLSIAHQNFGAVDLVVVGEAHSDFASRMGARSLWHEAVGVLKIYDAWSGQEVGAVERTTRASGIGDLNAGRRALKQLGGVLAEALHELLAARASNATSGVAPASAGRAL